MKQFDRRLDSAWSWVVAAATFVLLFLAYGTAYTFGVFFSELASEFGADRAESALVFSVLAGLYPILAVISGPAADRFGTRPVCWFGMLAMSIGLFFASIADALWQVYVGFGLGVGIGIGFTFAPASAGVQRWFTRRRGLASGFSSTGVGISVLVLPPLVAALIDWRDWRAAMMTLAVLALVLGSLSAFLMKDPAVINRGRGADHTAGFDLKRALMSRGFVMFYLSSMFCCLSLFIPFVHLITYSLDQGLGESVGIFLVAIIGVSSLFGRILLAAVSDRLGRRGSMTAIYFGTCISFLLWYTGGGTIVLSLFAIVFGICYGGYVAMIAPIIAENFGTERIGSVLGWFMSSVSLGGVLGPWFAGYAFDLWGSYDVPILAAAGFGLVAGLCALGMPSRPYGAGMFILPRAKPN
jgi:MFS family permease